MIITNCPRCGAMNATTTCTKCGWSQFTKSTVSTRITGEIEIMLSGKALLDDYKRLLLENRNLKERVAELEAAQRWIPVSERLPDNWESVLTIDISKSTQDVVSAFYNPETSLWSTHFSCDLWVTHWMPLPESPIVYGKVCEE